MPERPAKTLLILSQVYVPDPASVGQHTADAAKEMARRGWRVVVLTSGRGYENPRIRYPRRELLDGVEVRRLPLSSFGKRSILVRVLGSLLFLSQAFVRGLLVRRLGRILVSTSPPMASATALLIGFLRRIPLCYWVMDINPDQAVALGRVRAGSWSARLLEALNRLVLRRARDVIALDRFMARRLEKKTSIAGRLTILPPWPHSDAPEDLPHSRNPFRAEHGLRDKLVFMYSGNHSPSHPVTTILQAASRMEERADVLFLFVGGGLGKAEVDRAITAGARNVRSLPYQAFESIRFSLAAADVHLVTLGNDMAGIVHPCKVYGAMAAARPIFLVGPAECHITDILREHPLGWRCDHGDVDAVVRTISEIADRNPPSAAQAELKTMGRLALTAVDTTHGKRDLCGRFCDVLERPN